MPGQPDAAPERAARGGGAALGVRRRWTPGSCSFDVVVRAVSQACAGQDIWVAAGMGSPGTGEAAFCGESSGSAGGSGGQLSSQLDVKPAALACRNAPMVASFPSAPVTMSVERTIFNWTGCFFWNKYLPVLTLVKRLAWSGRRRCSCWWRSSSCSESSSDSVAHDDKALTAAAFAAACAVDDAVHRALPTQGTPQAPAVGAAGTGAMTKCRPVGGPLMRQQELIACNLAAASLTRPCRCCRPSFWKRSRFSLSSSSSAFNGDGDFGPTNRQSRLLLLLRSLSSL